MECPKCNCELKLVGCKELADMIGWDPRRLSTYQRRGKLPDPDYCIAAGPVWLESNPKLQEFINKYKKSVNNES